MNIQKLLIAGIAAGILYFFCGWLVYGNLLVSFMRNHPGTVAGVERTEMQFLYIAIGSLLQGFLLAFVFVKGNVSSLGSGFVTGGIVGFLYDAGVDSLIYGTSNVMSKTGVAADVVAFTVMSAVIGAIIGMMTGTKKQPYK